MTSGHVIFDEPSKHFPDRIEIELHTDPDNIAKSIGFSIPWYRDGKSIWRQGLDTAGEIDVAVIEITRTAMPETTVYRAFTPKHLHASRDQVEIGTTLLVVGFPLGFHDTLHHTPVVMRVSDQYPMLGDLPWKLLGVHSARLDVGTRDLKLDEALGLNCAWYADILLTLTE